MIEYCILTAHRLTYLVSAMHHYLPSRYTIVCHIVIISIEDGVGVVGEALSVNTVQPEIHFHTTILNVFRKPNSSTLPTLNCRPIVSAIMRF